MKNTKKFILGGFFVFLLGFLSYFTIKFLFSDTFNSSFSSKAFSNPKIEDNYTSFKKLKSDKTNKIINSIYKKNKGKYPDEVAEALKNYKLQDRSYSYGMVENSNFGKFVDCINSEPYYNSGNLIKFDNNGIPMVKYEGKYYYNPVSIAQFGLSKYAEYLDGSFAAKADFLKVCDKLIELLNEDGSFRYPFKWKNFNNKKIYEIGWVSALAQGHGLSMFSRAYYITHDEKYLNAGEKVLNFLPVNKQNGGTMTSLKDVHPVLKENLFFEEYVSTPDSYTLNGYMFTLIGLHDWAMLTKAFPNNVKENESMIYYNKGLESLKNVISLYDVGGFTSYDLGHITYDKTPRLIPGYHAVHIKLLHYLNSIKHDSTLYKYEQLWKSYVD